MKLLTTLKEDLEPGLFKLGNEKNKDRHIKKLYWMEISINCLLSPV